MASKLKTTNADKLKTGMKLIVNEVETSCDKIKLLGNNEQLYNQMQSIAKSLKTEGKNIDYVDEIAAFEKSLKNEKLFYVNKIGTSINSLTENSLLESAAIVLQEMGIDDYNSCSLFQKYLSKIEKCNKKKEFIDDIDEYINKLKIVIEQQSDLKGELSNITYTPVDYASKSISINSIESVETADYHDKIIELVKRIADIEKKQEDICEKTSELKSEQIKLFHGLPPNMNQAIMAVQIAEQTMKSVSKQLVEKLEKNSKL